MSFNVEYGNLFDHPAKGLAHGVNCLGVAGAGVALQMKRLYPEAIQKYTQKAAEGRLLPGSAMFCREPDRYIIHCASQHRPGPDARPEWLRSSLTDGLQMAAFHNIPSVALPLIGGGIGGIPPGQAQLIIAEVAEQFPSIEVTLVLPKVGP